MIDAGELMGWTIACVRQGFMPSAQRGSDVSSITLLATCMTAWLDAQSALAEAAAT